MRVRTPSTRPIGDLAEFNSCPKPDAVQMELKGKRLPGKPFLDIAGAGIRAVARWVLCLSSDGRGGQYCPYRAQWQLRFMARIRGVQVNFK